MADPLLDYSITTNPLPLYINGTNASIVIAATNPGFYSDKADTNYVLPTKVVFGFGTLLTSNPSGIAASGTYTPKNGTPVSLSAPQVLGAQFTFNLPDNLKVFPGDSLTFAFTKIAVGSQVASVALDLTETASAPGDPNPFSPDDPYPARPSAARTTTRQIGIFPANFAINSFTSSPTTVNPGLPTQLSWDATPLANTTFALVYAANGAVQTVTQHADGTLLKSTDTYPNSSNDPGLVLSINRTTTFSLQATYVKDGTRVTAEKQVTVSVPDPTILSYTATPSAGLLVGSAVNMAWRTLAADYVTIDPPLDGVQPVVPNSGSATIYPLQYNRYVLTASGRGLNVRQSIVLFPMAPGWTTFPKAPWLANLAPLTLAVGGQLWVLPGSPGSQSNPAYSSPDGQAWILATPNVSFPMRKNAAGLSDLSNGKAWVMGGINGSGGALNDVWSSPDGRTWTQVTGNAQWSPRSDFGCVWFNNLYWVMGGRDGSGNPLNDIWTSPDGVTWTKKPGTPAWSARSAFGLTVSGGSLWLFGGRTSNGVDSGLWTSTDGVTWQNPTNPLGNSPSARTQCKLFSPGGDKLYAVTGIDGGGNGLVDAWVWSIQGRNWSPMSGPAFPQGAKYFGSTSYNGGLWLAGGGNDNVFGNGTWLYVPT